MVTVHLLADHTIVTDEIISMGNSSVSHGSFREIQVHWGDEPVSEPVLMNVKQVAEKMGSSAYVKAIYKAISDKKLRSTRAFGRILVDWRDVLRMIEQGWTSPQSDEPPAPLNVKEKPRRKAGKDQIVLW